MTQVTDPLPADPVATEPWTTWGQPAEEPAGSSARKSAAAIIVPVAILAVLALGVVMFLLTADPAGADAAIVGCGGG